MAEQFTEEENKGQYCQFVRTGDGKVKLVPVKVPAHVKAQRAERIRKRELQSRVAQNRARAQALNRWSVAFLALALTICCGVCCLYLSLQSRVASRMSEIICLQEQIEEISADNNLRKQRLSANEDLNAVRREAWERFGMREAGEDQIVYYTIDYRDYMFQYGDIE